MAATKIHLVVEGSLEHDQVIYSVIGAFTNKHAARRLLRVRKVDDPYGAQYDEIQSMNAYGSLARWMQSQTKKKGKK